MQHMPRAGKSHDVDRVRLFVCAHAQMRANAIIMCSLGVDVTADPYMYVCAQQLMLLMLYIPIYVFAPPPPLPISLPPPCMILISCCCPP
jgi:hypothetical protein